MIQKRHNVVIMIADKTLELKNDESLNLRINNIIYDPTKIQSSQAEYSFTFNVPVTPKNTEIFDFANVLSKTNKFNKLYNAIVYADGNEIFRGQLKIKEISDNEFKCNLISVKINSVEEIFKESKMNEVQWYVPYTGMFTIDNVNRNMDSDYYFPLISYGCFQKVPKATYSNEYNAYTSKYALDKYVQWYPQTLSPCVKINELVKKMFNQKGYNVNGDIFEDDIANEIYLTTSLADKQDPLYNYGTDLGKCEVRWKFWTNGTPRVTTEGSGSYGSYATANRLSYNLTHKYNLAKYPDTYNFDTVHIWDIWQNAKKYSGTPSDPRLNRTGLYGQELTYNNKELFRNGAIVIPADGAYKIDLDVEIDINDAKAFPCYLYNSRGEQENHTASHNWNTMPVEIQLIRNGTDTELIHGYDGTINSVYPHEAPNTAQQSQTGTRPFGGSGSSTRPSRRENVTRAIGGGGTEDGDETITIQKEYNMGYMPRQTQMLAYDPFANPNFICGFSSIGNCPSVIKRGYSWNSEASSEYIYSRYNCNGYWGVNWNGSSYDWEPTTYNTNTYNSAPKSYLTDSGLGFTKKGHLSCVVYLKKNDVLNLKMVTRCYEVPDKNYTVKMGSGRDWKVTVNTYQAICSGTIKIEAYSPNTADIESTNLTYYSKTKYDTELNLGQFMNKQTKQSDFINNYIKAFNLNYNQTGNTVTLNKNYIDFSRPLVPINLDDRVNNSNITITPIDYPSSMEVKYNINDEEAGFYNSVPSDKVEGEDWKDYAYRGSEKVSLSQDEDAEPTEVQLSNSYTWYAPFIAYQYDADGNATEGKQIMLPLISKDEYMIENYKYEESMQVDGKGLPQRWFFRQLPNENITFYTVNGDAFSPSIPINTKDGFTLNYENEDNTLLTRFFNITAYTSSDMIEFECYITPDEYILLKKGAPIKINSDVYYTCKITGYDPTGNNEVKITAMKKG